MLKQYGRDAMPGGALNPEISPENVRMAAELASMTPNPIGDVASLGLAVDDIRKGDYGSAALNSVGVLPFVPAMGGVVRNKKLADASLKHFGQTHSAKETGFLLDDATRLDLSGRHYASGYENRGGKYVPKIGQPDYLAGGRNVDHRELSDLVPDGGWQGLSQFMNESGAVRYMPEQGISVVDTNMPSQRQIEAAVRDFRQARRPMNVDVDPLSGNSAAVSMEFERPTVDAVMEFLKKNMKPEAFK